MSEDIYWNNYYSKAIEIQKRRIPSQFSMFTINEIDELCTVVDVGCGDGRDTFAFHNFGFDVIGIDRSETAIKECQLENSNCIFINSPIEDDYLIEKTLKAIAVFGNRKTVIYSRFFLHSINDFQQKKMFKFVTEIMKKNDLFFLEFRTLKDKYQRKVTDQHYRRYISTTEFIKEVNDLGFKVDYFCEGFGLAKYKDDDAYVARFILKFVGN